MERVDGGSTGEDRVQMRGVESDDESPEEKLSGELSDAEEVSWDSLIGVKEKASSHEVEVFQSNFEANIIRRMTSAFPDGMGLDIVSPYINSGIRAIANDSFWKCFRSDSSQPWNWNLYLFPLWIGGVFLRYCILLPIRFIALLLGTLIFSILFAPTVMISNVVFRRKIQSFLMRMYAKVWLFSFTAVVRVHGIKPERRINRIFVANHTSLVDVIVLNSISTFGLVGQAHSGIVGIFEQYVFDCLSSIWFDRSESKDRSLVKKRLKEHIMDPENADLLMFPEGTCVNNGNCLSDACSRFIVPYTCADYIVMFKKGAFDIGAVVCPIALKYNKVFSDAHYNSRVESFFFHSLRLMYSWALVVEVWFLDPMEMNEGENTSEFARRVKMSIAKAARLTPVPWDGYYKYVRPNENFKTEWQKLFASEILKRISGSRNREAQT